MRITLCSYPMLSQRLGSLQVQVLETLEALQRAGVEASLFDWRREKLTDFDLVHVFAAINGMHRVVEAANDANVPVVLSSVLHPPFTAWDRRMASLGDSIVGRLTGWSHHASFRELQSCLAGVRHIVALGAVERDMLLRGY